MRGERVREALTACALAAVVALFFSDILFFGFNLYLRDFSRTSYPERKVLSSILRGGELPMWNPFATGGQPLAANPSYEAFYPPQWLLMFGSYRAAIHLVVVLHFALAAAGMFLLMRSLRTGRSVACFCGFAYALGGALLSMAAVLPFLYAMAWLPWLGFFFRRAVRRDSWRAVAAAALTLGLILLAAEVSMILQAGALVGAYALRVARRERRWRPILFAIAIVVVATLIGAVQILPALAHQRDSGRSRPLAFDVASNWSMPPYRIVEMIWPTLFSSASPDVIFQWGLARIYPKEGWPWVLSIYPGLLVAMLVIAGFVARVRGSGFVAIIAASGFILAVGRFGFLFPLLYRLGLRSLRYPEKFILSTLFILVVFAGMAAEEAMTNANVRKTLLIVAMVITAITGALSLLTIMPAFPRWFARAFLFPSIDLDLAARFRSEMVLSLAIAAMITALLAAQKLAPWVRVPLLALVVMLDHGMRVQGWAPRITADFYDPPPAARALAATSVRPRIYNPGSLQLAEARALPVGILPWMTRNGLFPSWEWSFGFDGVMDRDVTFMNLVPSIEFANLFRQVESRNRLDRLPMLLQMAGASHVGVNKPLDPAVVADPRRFDEVEPVQFVPLSNDGPYYFAERIIPDGRLEAFARAILSSTPLPRRTVFADLPAMQPAEGRVLGYRRTANTLALDVDAQGRALLALAVTPHRYWRATIDGAPASLRVANVGFQALIVERGRHRIELRYRNPLVIACAWISALVAVLVAAIVSVDFVAALRSREPQPPSQH